MGGHPQVRAGIHPGAAHLNTAGRQRRAGEFSTRMALGRIIRGWRGTKGRLRGPDRQRRAPQRDAHASLLAPSPRPPFGAAGHRAPVFEQQQSQRSCDFVSAWRRDHQRRWPRTIYLSPRCAAVPEIIRPGFRADARRAIIAGRGGAAGGRETRRQPREWVGRQPSYATVADRHFGR